MDNMPAVDVIYAMLLESAGHQGWWPGDSPFEIAVGAVLTQNTSWKGVEKAVSSLKQAGLMSADSLLAATDETVAALIRPAGYFNVKTARLKSLCRFLADNCGGDPRALANSARDDARTALLSVKGVGRETADSILLYAAGVPIFVVDAYTRRIFGRMGLIDPVADYDEIRLFFENGLPLDASLYSDYHAQIVRCAKECCQTRPMCLKCALSGICRLALGGSLG